MQLLFFRFKVGTFRGTFHFCKGILNVSKTLIRKTVQSFIKRYLADNLLNTMVDFPALSKPWHDQHLQISPANTVQYNGKLQATNRLLVCTHHHQSLIGQPITRQWEMICVAHPVMGSPNAVISRQVSIVCLSLCLICPCHETVIFKRSSALHFLFWSFFWTLFVHFVLFS